MRRIQTGFTLIELVVVITILGILAAFAIPRFVKLDTQARVAALSGLAGSLRGAAALAHGEYLSLGTAPVSVLMDGQAVPLSNGYPTVAGIQAALQDTSGYNPVVGSGTPPSISFQQLGGSDPTNCMVTYTESSAPGASPTVTGPLTSGC